MRFFTFVSFHKTTPPEALINHLKIVSNKALNSRRCSRFLIDSPLYNIEVSRDLLLYKIVASQNSPLCYIAASQIAPLMPNCATI
jgi:hypothetical protein